MSSLRPEALTWTGLLAQWMRFAQASLSLPKNAEGDRWRSSVPAIINLQAVTFAVADLDQLAPDERALSLDKAEILINQSSADIQRIWRNETHPEMITEIIADATTALRVQREFRA